MYPLYAVLIRIGVFLSIGIAGLTFLPRRRRSADCICRDRPPGGGNHHVWLAQQEDERASSCIWHGVVKGILAAVVGGLATYFVAVYLPGSAALTALIGTVVGGLIALPIIWSEE